MKKTNDGVLRIDPTRTYKHVLHWTNPNNDIDNQLPAMLLVLYFSNIFINFWLIELTTQYILSNRTNLLY